MRHGWMWGLATLTVVQAAPVPKAKPTMESVYGTPVESVHTCTAEMGRDRQLVLTKLSTGYGCHTRDVASIGPQVAREVEGDFTLVTKMTLCLPERAGSTDHNKSGQAAAAAGVCVHDGATRDEQCAAITVGTHDVNKPWARWFEYHWGEKKGAGGGVLKGFDFAKPVWLRASRKGKEVSVAYSLDGTKWEVGGTFSVRGKVRVGPVAYGCLDCDIVARFEEYELNTGEL